MMVERAPGELVLDLDGPVTVEVFTLARLDHGLVLTGPCGAAPWLIQAGPGEHPLDTARRIVSSSLDGLLLLHSTSWRYEREAIVLSFVAVIEPASIGDVDRADIGRSDLARNDAVGAPEAIESAQVIEHGLRHLAWLAKEDAVVRDTLDAGWHAILDGYVPEPFQQVDAREVKP